MQREIKTGRTRTKVWEKPEICWSVSRFFPMWLFYLFSSVLVLLYVAQWFRNMCPSRRVTPSSESLQTNTPAKILDSRSTFPPAPALCSHLLHPSNSPFHFYAWWCVWSCGPAVVSWCEPNPSGTQYPVYQLSALCKPQQYWAEAEVQNSLQSVQVTGKVEVVSFSVTPPCRL